MVWRPSMTNAGMPYLICSSTGLVDSRCTRARMRSRMERTSTGYWRMYSATVVGVVAIPESYAASEVGVLTPGRAEHPDARADRPVPAPAAEGVARGVVPDLDAVDP